MHLRLVQPSQKGLITTKTELRKLSKFVSGVLASRSNFLAKQELVALVNAYACRHYDEELTVIDEHGGEPFFEITV